MNALTSTARHGFKISLQILDTQAHRRHDVANLYYEHSESSLEGFKGFLRQLLKTEFRFRTNLSDN